MRNIDFHHEHITKKDALGKGIRSLLQNIDADLKTTSGNLKPEVVEKKEHQHAHRSARPDRSEPTSAP